MNVLVIAPHDDDEVLGVGGTIAKHVSKGDRVYVCIVTSGTEPLFYKADMAVLARETKRVHDFLGVSHTYFLGFPAAMLEDVPRFQLNQAIMDVIQETKPEIVYLPHFGDMQKDHTLTAEAAMVGLRPKYDHVVREIYAYETLSETEWNIPHSKNVFIPNAFSDISDHLDAKLKALAMYTTQVADFPNPRSVEAVSCLAKLRGSTINVAAAEAFYLIRKIS